jgi:hypothetical protein
MLDLLPDGVCVPGGIVLDSPVDDLRLRDIRKRDA